MPPLGFPTLNKPRRKIRNGIVRCSWCSARAYLSLWSPGYPQRYLGDACSAHRGNVPEGGTALRIDP